VVTELERRMRARGQDSDAVIRRRLASAEEEISHAVEFDYVIINKDFDVAKQDLQAIIRVERLRKARG
jgi:guanylate kinase